ncbi:NAD(P) transhydrogenase subunit alpha [Sphingobium sp. CR2-8]|uniref:NAD(P) transhydrogenase subunit alpha n=1 Tax=Sphingobium sp. CR2-8 TaxID=1306534 RepID=UPI002DB62084|nr:NAD(P) transhydrogenase subunit alpha [Sphingobium sp. CR2-8]MEC3910426.1 NAD(P) transhydrogenase subunit alpha [Sphingobium sp. CR2-8]
MPVFLLACLGGYVVARPGADAATPYWRAGVGGVAAIILVGALIAAAEAGSAAARYMALMALLCASTAAVLLLGVVERRWPPIEQDTVEGDPE